MYFSAVSASGFSTKRLDLGDPQVRDRCGAGPDVAVAGGGSGGGNAEGDDVALCGGLCRLRAQGLESFDFLHDMVGGEHGDDGVGRAGGGDFAGDGDGGGGIATLRLKHDLPLNADLLHLLLHEKAVIVIGDDHRLGENLRVQAQQRVLKGGAVAEQGDELFGHCLARGGPNTRACAAAHDDWNDFLHMLPASP